MNDTSRNITSRVFPKTKLIKLLTYECLEQLATIIRGGRGYKRNIFSLHAIKHIAANEEFVL